MSSRMDRRWGRVTVAAGVLIYLVMAGTLRAQMPDRLEALPVALEEVQVEERLGERVPMDLTFVDSAGQSVRLGDYFTGDRPVVLTLVYYECPMLCTLVVNGLTEAMKNLDWLPGREFEVITVSFNPAETVELARLKKQGYLAEYGRPEAAGGWHFLVGDATNTKALADAVGFGYRWDEQAEQFIHQAVIMILTPGGRVSRYLYGVMFEPKTVRLSLVEASNGQVGTTADRIYLSCFRFDPKAGSYAMGAMSVLRLSGVATLVALAAAVGLFAMIGARRRARAAGGDGTALHTEPSHGEKA